MLLCSFTLVELPAGPRCELVFLLSPGYADAPPMQVCQVTLYQLSQEVYMRIIMQGRAM